MSSLVFEVFRRRMAGIIIMVELSIYHAGSRGSVESVGKSRGGFEGTSTTAAVVRTSEPIVSYTRLMSLWTKGFWLRSELRYVWLSLVTFSSTSSMRVSRCHFQVDLEILRKRFCRQRFWPDAFARLLKHQKAYIDYEDFDKISCVHVGITTCHDSRLLTQWKFHLTTPLIYYTYYNRL